MPDTCLRVILPGLCLLALTSCGTVTTTGYVQKQQRPEFKEGHRLPPLTRFGWGLPVSLQKELAEHWGYCLQFAGYVDDRTVEALSLPFSEEREILSLAANDPSRYPLAVVVNRQMPLGDMTEDAMTRKASGELVDREGKGLGTSIWQPGMKTLWSPAASDKVWEEAGRLRAEPLREIQKRAPIRIVLNGGEYGITVTGFGRPAWEQDPKIMKQKGERSWQEYVSERKANAERIIREAVLKAAPTAKYFYYPTSGSGHRHRYRGWDNWDYDYRYMKPVSDYASGVTSNGRFATGLIGERDMLTLFLNAKGYEIAMGQPYSYQWGNAGWRPDRLLEIRRYEGLLKCLYTAGMIGGVAGYFSYPKGGFDTHFWEDEPPHWLLQMLALSRVHALFSHHDDFLFQSDLLPGPDRHRWSQDQPAYEFPTGDPGVRVLARKHRDKAAWLVTAWAASGEAREVKVEIPDLGPVVLEAKPEGNVMLLGPDA